MESSDQDGRRLVHDPGRGQDLGDRRSALDLAHDRRRSGRADAHQPGAGVAGAAVTPVRLGAAAHDHGHLGERLDVLHERRPAAQAPLGETDDPVGGHTGAPGHTGDERRGLAPTKP